MGIDLNANASDNVSYQKHIGFYKNDQFPLVFLYPSIPTITVPFPPCLRNRDGRSSKWVIFWCRLDGYIPQ